MGVGPSGEEDYGSKEWMRKNRRRPIQETLDELGEGRGKLDLNGADLRMSLTFFERDLRSWLSGTQG